MKTDDHFDEAASARHVEGDVDGSLNLLAEVYDFDSGASYRSEFPTLFCKEGNLLVSQINETTTAACAAARLGYIDGGPFPLGAARIGSVATSARHRGRGLASDLMVSLHQRLKQQAMALSILWAERGGLYARLGYHPVGCAWLLSIPPNLSAPYQPGFRIMQGPLASLDLPSRGDHGDTFHLRCTNAEWRSLKHIPNIHAAIGLRGSSIDAFALMGKGHDMQAVVHDWGGSVEDTLALLTACRSHSTQPPRVLVPHGHPIQGQLSGPAQAMPMAWMKILDRTRLLAWAQTPTTPVSLNTLSDQALLHTLFGYPPGAAARNSSPLCPLFIWGMDSL